MADENFAPIFFIGFPRSGTTIAFDPFSRHESLAWPSLYTDKYPGCPWLNSVRFVLDNRFIQVTGRKGSRYNKTIVGNRLFPQSAEAYNFWNRYSAQDFSRSFLRGRIAEPLSALRTREQVRKLMTWQGRSRFAAKITGPSRIAFISSIFPDAIFIHIVRDGRAAVHSLLNVPFWRDKGGLIEPFWSGGLLEEDLQVWENHGRDPGVLAALQWNRTVEGARAERREIESHRYKEVRYEAFIESPHATLSEIYEFCGLEDSRRGHQLLEDDGHLVNMNDKYRAEFSDDYLRTLVAVMEPQLREFNYIATD